MVDVSQGNARRISAVQEHLLIVACSLTQGDVTDGLQQHTRVSLVASESQDPVGYHSSSIDHQDL